MGFKEACMGWQGQCLSQEATVGALRKLSIGFGSRGGRGVRHLAIWQGGNRNIIALTHGDGTLAHEFGHALEGYFLGDPASVPSPNGQRAMVLIRESLGGGYNKAKIIESMKKALDGTIYIKVGS